VHITNDRPLLKVNFWAIRTVAIAEPRIQLRCEPGSEAHWMVRYDFHTMLLSTNSETKN
jgi:hypothetical protein